MRPEIKLSRIIHDGSSRCTSCSGRAAGARHFPKCGLCEHRDHFNGLAIPPSEAARCGSTGIPWSLRASLFSSYYEQEIATRLVAGKLDVRVERRLRGVEAYLLAHPCEYLGPIHDAGVVAECIQESPRKYRVAATTPIGDRFEGTGSENRASSLL